MEFQDEILHEATGGLKPGDRAALAKLALSLHESQLRNEQLSRMVFSLENREQLFRCLILLKAFPKAANTIKHLFVKAPGSGILEVIEQFGNLCPQLETYWGYLTRFPRDASDHLDVWMKMLDNPDQFVRGQLKGLSGADQIVLWSRSNGYQPA